LIFTAHRGIIIIILYECADARVHNLPRTSIVYSVDSLVTRKLGECIICPARA